MLVNRREMIPIAFVNVDVIKSQFAQLDWVWGGQIRNILALMKTIYGIDGKTTKQSLTAITNWIKNHGLRRQLVPIGLTNTAVHTSDETGYLRREDRRSLIGK